MGSCMKKCWNRSISRSSCGYLARTSQAKPPPFAKGRSFRSRCSWLPRLMCTSDGHASLNASSSTKISVALRPRSAMSPLKR
eukprot:scaffold155036_cov23-Tisochrysis_lutea.AAC.2